MTNGSVSWRHRIDLPGEGKTDGFKDPEVDLDLVRVPNSLAGERLLDIGCSDGGHSFACEKRGASVTGLDDQSSPRNEGRNNFELARATLGSSATYVHGNTVDFAASTPEPFDRVLHFNVLYHVISPTGGSGASVAAQTGRHPSLEDASEFTASDPRKPLASPLDVESVASDA